MTFTPTGAPGSVVHGTLYVDGVTDAVPPYAQFSASEVAAIPYEYTIQRHRTAATTTSRSPDTLTRTRAQGRETIGGIAGPGRRSLLSNCVDRDPGAARSRRLLALRSGEARAVRGARVALAAGP